MGDFEGKLRVGFLELALATGHGRPTLSDLLVSVGRFRHYLVLAPSSHLWMKRIGMLPADRQTPAYRIGGLLSRLDVHDRKKKEEQEESIQMQRHRHTIHTSNTSNTRDMRDH